MTGTYEGEHNGIVSIDITNSSSSNVTVSYINSYDMTTWNEKRILRGDNDTINALCGTLIGIIAFSANPDIDAKDWNNELKLVTGESGGCTFYVPLDALGTAHIVVQDY